MVSTMTCQASLLNFGKTKPAPSSNVPLHQPLGYSRPQTATFAASGALAYGTGLLSNTVRKASAKLEEIDPEETFSKFFGSQPEAKRSGQPNFKSALEAVSYQTNSSLREDRSVQRKTVVGRVARMFGR